MKIRKSIHEFENARNRGKGILASIPLNGESFETSRTESRNRDIIRKKEKLSLVTLIYFMTASLSHTIIDLLLFSFRWDIENELKQLSLQMILCTDKQQNPDPEFFFNLPLKRKSNAYNSLYHEWEGRRELKKNNKEHLKII